MAADRLLLPLCGMVAYRFIDDVAVPIRHTDDDGQIFLLNFTRLELGSQGIVRLVILRDNDHAARVAIEPMYDSRPRRSAACAQRAEMMGQRACERAFPMALCRVNNHPSRFVDDD